MGLEAGLVEAVEHEGDERDGVVRPFRGPRRCRWCERWSNQGHAIHCETTRNGYVTALEKTLATIRKGADPRTIDLIDRVLPVDRLTTTW